MSPSGALRRLAAALLLAFSAKGTACATAPQTEAAPVAIAAELSADGSRTRLVFTLSRPVEAKASVMERPNRVVLDLPEVNFQLPEKGRRTQGGAIASYRTGLFAPGRSRIVLELSQPAVPAKVEAAMRPDGAAILTIELARADVESFRAAAQASLPPALTEPPPPARSPDSRPLIMLDPGHGGIDPGARTSAGVLEKDVVFAFTRRLKTRLEATGRYRVLSTRDTDVFVALDERVRLARTARADLLISIHADSISAAPHVRGFTVYTVADRASDEESARLAESENKADQAAGLEPSAATEEVADILQDLTKRETKAFSHRFAGKLIGELASAMRLNTNPHRQAGFRVLRAPDVPSVLIELGYLSSQKDIDLLLSDTWRDRMAASLTLAIDQYFASRVASGAPSRGTAAVSP
jgi:N-acetylmuramoyl-L-alanine amidase